MVLALGAAVLLMQFLAHLGTLTAHLDAVFHFLAAAGLLAGLAAVAAGPAARLEGVPGQRVMAGHEAGGQLAKLLAAGSQFEGPGMGLGVSAALAKLLQAVGPGLSAGPGALAQVLDVLVVLAVRAPARACGTTLRQYDRGPGSHDSQHLATIHLHSPLLFDPEVFGPRAATLTRDLHYPRLYQRPATYVPSGVESAIRETATRNRAGVLR